MGRLSALRKMKHKLMKNETQIKEELEKFSIHPVEYQARTQPTTTEIREAYSSAETTHRASAEASALDPQGLG